jgi:aspartyl-tRNA(Asn)/glutamyl-tRNA(Gln) amidotransferase subunit B
VPLLEIVSEPDIRSAEQAKRYVEELRATLFAIGVSDVKMEEGSLRIDANVSVRASADAEFGTRAEIKNLNSLRSLVRAVEYETARQAGLLEAGERVVQETRHWDEDGGRTISGRSKEEAHDYRYFPEPDLVPVAPTDAMRAEVRASMPELPGARRARLIADWGIKDEDARVLVDVPGLADYAERAVAALNSGSPRDVANWVRQDVLAYLNDRGLAPAVLTPEMLAELVGLVADGTISRGQAKDVLMESMAEEQWPRDIVKTRGLAQVSDAGELGAVVDAVLARESATVEQYRTASDDKDRSKKRNALVGQVMRELKGKGNPQLVNQLLDERLS